jgi:uncharacterized protein (DUF2164 family)
METEKTEKLTAQEAGQYWYNRGFRDKELQQRVAETLANEELIDDNSETCKTCD